MSSSALRVTPLSLLCKECGSSFQREGRSAREYCSEECRATRKRRLRSNPPTPICEICGKEFVRSSGRQKFCVSCREVARSQYTSEYFVANTQVLRAAANDNASRRRRDDPERVRELDRAWKAKNWDAILENRRTPEERAKSSARLRRRYATEPDFAINRRMSAGILSSLASGKGGCSWEDLVDYSISDLLSHLERQFLPGMSWANRSEWHIDHIQPLASFSFESADDPEFRAAWALTNLRPLWAVDNLKKSDQRIFLL